MNFTVYGDPTPKARPRLGKGGNVYTPPATKQAEFLIQQAFRFDSDRTKLDGPVSLSVYFCFKMPKRLKGKPEPHIVVPDLDNLVKTVKDALNGLAYWDDAQVTDIHAFKRYTTGKPRTEITIEPATTGY